MKIMKIVGIVFIVLGLYTGYIGLNKLVDNTNQVNFLGIKIDADNEKGQTKGIMFLGAGLLLITGGVFAIKKDSK